jgi:hypothetical protein
MTEYNKLNRPLYPGMGFDGEFVAWRNRWDNTTEEGREKWLIQHYYANLTEFKSCMWMELPVDIKLHYLPELYPQIVVEVTK